ncbi:hypothetical protein ACF09I_34365 [Streptomyces sp. NPDC014940]|uniref:hypothetical protein n=1 Tax=Streptomyces sp. NPDC014940 TaxID=3364932 RepID=UPI0036FCB855
MPGHEDALTRLVQQHVGRGRRLTFRAFEEQAVDPASGHRISKSTAENIVKGHQIKLTPEIVRAVAAGLEVPLAQVREAAIRQYVGIELSDPFATGTGDDDTVIRVAHQVDATAEELDHVRRSLEGRDGS